MLPGKIPPLIMCVALTSVLFIYICECRDSLKSSETRYNRQSSDKGLWDQKGADTSLLTDTIFRNTGFKAIGRRASVMVNSCRGVGNTFWLGRGGAQSETTHRVVSNLYNDL